MSKSISIITPAYRATTTIERAVRSALAQTLPNWEMLIVSDDGVDYESLLARAGILDQRLRFLSTGDVGTGSSAARNVALDAAEGDLIAILDADDLMVPQKLALASVKLDTYGIVSTGLSVVDKELQSLRKVGVGADVFLSAGSYKFTNFSMDSMLVYDRRPIDARYAPDFPHLTDIEFLLKLFAHHEGCFHIGAPLHTYVKEPMSLSNAPGASARLGQTKQRLMALLQAGHYPFADPQATAGLLDFYDRSLTAEQAYAEAFTTNPALLFEDHLETFLTS